MESFLDNIAIHVIQPILSHHQIQELKHEVSFVREPIELGPTASYHYAIGLCSMPNLRSLTLRNVKPSDEFFSTMASEASKSKVYLFMISAGNWFFLVFTHFKLNICANHNLQLKKK